MTECTPCFSLKTILVVSGTWALDIRFSRNPENTFLEYHALIYLDDSKFMIFRSEMNKSHAINYKMVLTFSDTRIRSDRPLNDQLKNRVCHCRVISWISLCSHITHIFPFISRIMSKPEQNLLLNLVFISSSTIMIREHSLQIVCNSLLTNRYKN